VTFVDKINRKYPGFNGPDSVVLIEIVERANCKILSVELNQPDTRNPLDLQTADLFSKLCDFCLDWESELPFEALIIQGRGKAFSAGGDFDFLKQRTQVAERENIATMMNYYHSFLKIRSIPVVTVANVHAAAIGAGLCLALACDLMLANSDAKLGFPFLKLGINPGMAAYPLLRRRVGETRSRDLLFSGRFFSGKDLHDWGGAWKVYKNEAEAQNILDEWLFSYSGSSTFAVSQLRQEILLHETRDIDHSLSSEAQGQANCYAGKDFHERLENTLQRISKKSQ
tara:strand:- start:991 stop:1842 length:852 start_codon:yes stop_codon:yes gene_type:complete